MLVFDQVLARDILLRFWLVIVPRLLLHVDNRFSGLWMLLALSWSRWLLHASRWARLQAEWGEFEDLGRSWGVLVACHESSVISESGNDGVVSSWYVSSENQVQERAENASLRYSWVDWKDWRGIVQLAHINSPPFSHTSLPPQAKGLYLKGHFRTSPQHDPN